jgi:diguanylate cyclase (GGDEF)-like protein/PAS domain S-box-containing protein
MEGQAARAGGATSANGVCMMSNDNVVEDLWSKSDLIIALGHRLLDILDEAVFYTDSNLLFMGANSSFHRLTGISPETLAGGDLGLLYGDEEGSRLLATMRLELPRHGQWQGEVRRLRPDGTSSTERLLIAAVDGDDGLPEAYIGLIKDTSELRSAKALLEYSANHDALTGLANRDFFNAALDDRAARSAAQGGAIAVCTLDLDDFKRVNNDLSREAGDELLKSVGLRLQEALRSGDLLARTGGDEFSLAVSLKSGMEPRGLASRLLALFDAPFETKGRFIYVNATIGMALCPLHGDSAARLISCADLALQTRKKGSKNSFAVYRDDLGAELQGKTSLATELRSAIAQQKGTGPATSTSAGRFFVNYQPVIDIATGHITSVEALSRWTHPLRGAVPPSSFIPVAEESGLIVELGGLVLRCACDRARAWLKESRRPPRICVNVSARQLQEPSFLDEVAQASKGLPPGFLVLEITESQLVDDLRGTAKILGDLKGKGVSLSVDDFGTGYASLSYLKMLPIDTVKIDQSFVADLFHNRNDRRIVEAVTTLSKGIGAKTIAEGVETQAQLELLKEIGCDYAQGFLFSKAIPPEELELLMDGRYDDTGRFERGR